MRCLYVVDQRPPSATNAAMDAVASAVRKVITPGLPTAMRSIQYAASSTAKRNRNRGISHESQRPGVEPHGGCPIPRTMLDANGMPIASVRMAPAAAYGRGQRTMGWARMTAYTAIRISAELMQSAPAFAVSGPPSFEK